MARNETNINWLLWTNDKLWVHKNFVQMLLRLESVVSQHRSQQDFLFLQGESE